MVDPDDAHVHERHRVGGVGQPGAPPAQLGSLATHVEDEERGGDGEDAVAERLQPSYFAALCWHRLVRPVVAPPAGRVRQAPRPDQMRDCSRTSAGTRG